MPYASTIYYYIIKGLLHESMVNVVPHNISYCTRNLVQYDILLGTIFTNIHAITLCYTLV